MSENEIAPEIVELILRTSRVKGCPGVFSLAPRGHRVGMYFQQRRATLLAKALVSRVGQKNLAEASIGIIGGGVSGVTALLAMKSFGAENVVLYEAKEDVFSTGAAAPHRLVHPNYNRWPLLGSMDAFTNLPVLNWHAAPADKVASQLRNGLSKDFAEYSLDRIKKCHVAKKIVQRSTEYAEPVSVTLATPDGERTETFRICIIAAGFDEEHCTKWGFEDYWARDPGSFDEGTHKRPCVIYGAGDGALIDIIRSCATKPDNAWQVPLGTIARLRPDNATTLLKDSRQHAEPRPVDFSSIEKEIRTHEESIRSMAWGIAQRDAAAVNNYALEEAKFYRGCVKQLNDRYGSVTAYLEEHLKPCAEDSNCRPKIVSTFEHPFEPTSAPINKLLLAYLLETKRVEPIKRDRQTVTDELERWNEESAAGRRARIVICRFGAAKNFPVIGDTFTDNAIAVFLAEDGKEVPVVETDTEASLIDVLSGVTGGEYLYFDAIPHPLVLARHGDDARGRNNSTRRQYEPILQSFAQEHLSADHVTLVPGEGEGGPRWVVMTSLTDDQITERLREIGGLDGNFCGAPIVVAPPSQHASVRGF